MVEAGRGGAVWLVALRFIARSGARPRWTTLLGVLGALGVLVGGGLLLAQAGGMLGLVAFVLGAFASVVALSLRYLVPTIAVASLGIAFGVAALYSVMAVTSGFEAELLRGTARINGHLLVTKYGIDFFEYERLAAQLEGRPEVRAASPFAWGMVSATRVSEEDGEELAQGEPVVAALKGLDPERVGRFADFGELFDSGDASTLAPGHLHLDLPTAALGRRVARELGVEVGDRIRIVAPPEIDGSEDPFAAPVRAASFDVVDLVDTGIADLDAQIILVHLRPAQSLLFGEGRVTGIELELHEPGEAELVAPEIQDALNPPDQGFLYRCMDWAAGSTSVVVMRNIRQIVSLILSLIVLVAGSTLVGGLLIIIRRRRKHIAMLGAMGASRTTVFLIFEAAGLAAGLVGAVLGLALGGVCGWALSVFRWPLDPSVYPIDYLPVAPRWVDGLIPAGVAIAVCLLLSGPAALSAARLPLLANLRGR